LAGPFESFQIGTKAGEPPQAKIDLQGMSPHEVADVRVQAIAPIMPTSLIRPMAADAADATVTPT
jgi:hypothetical protein